MTITCLCSQKGDLSGRTPRSATTVNKIVRAERKGLLDKVPGFANPFGKAIRFSVDARETRRKHFEKSDLKAVVTVAYDSKSRIELTLSEL